MKRTQRCRWQDVALEVALENLKGFVRKSNRTADATGRIEEELRHPSGSTGPARHGSAQDVFALPDLNVVLAARADVPEKHVTPCVTRCEAPNGDGSAPSPV